MFLPRLDAEFPIFDKLPLVKGALWYISRSALLVYIIHLMLFRLIQLTKWGW